MPRFLSAGRRPSTLLGAGQKKRPYRGTAPYGLNFAGIRPTGINRHASPGFVLSMVFSRGIHAGAKDFTGEGEIVTPVDIGRQSRETRRLHGSEICSRSKNALLRFFASSRTLRYPETSMYA